MGSFVVILLSFLYVWGLMSLTISGIKYPTEHLDKIFNITTKEVIVTCVSTAVHGDDVSLHK